MDINEFDDFISNIWMNLRMQDWNDYLFPFKCLIIIGMEMKKKQIYNNIIPYNLKYFFI